MGEINASIGFDRKLWRQDIRGSLAHAAMLARAGIISPADEAAIRDGLAEIGAEIEAGRFSFSAELEDIHMNIEARKAGLFKFGLQHRWHDIRLRWLAIGNDRDFTRTKKV